MAEATAEAGTRPRRGPGLPMTVLTRLGAASDIAVVVRPTHGATRQRGSEAKHVVHMTTAILAAASLSLAQRRVSAPTTPACSGSEDGSST